MPSTRESKPPSPLLEPMLSAAAYHRARGELDEALDAYKKALMLAETAELGTLATIYAHIGTVKRLQGKLREAELNFEKALDASPGHRRSLDALCEMARTEKKFAKVAEYRRRIVAVIDEPLEKADELSRLATTLAEDLHDARGAAEALELAREHRTEDPVILMRLKELYSQLEAWPQVVDLYGALCMEADDAKDRALCRFAQAEISLEKLNDEPRALLLLEAVLEEDSSHEQALSMLIARRTARREWRELERAYTRLIDDSAERGRSDRAADFCTRLGKLRRTELSDPEGAIEAFSGALRCDPRDVSVRAELADLFAAQGERPAAVQELQIAAVYAPRREETYRRLFEIHTHEGHTDRAWLAAMALEELKVAELDHELIADQYRPEGALRPANALDDVAWDSFIRAPGSDESVAQILRAVGPAAIQVRVQLLTEAKKLNALPPERKQDIAGTASIVRTFVWASQVLGVALPDLYLLDEVPAGGVAAVQVATPSTALGKAVVSGLPVQELAFIAARHLTYYRPEHYALVFYPTLNELTVLFLAAVRVSLTELPVPAGIEASVLALQKKIEALLTPDAREALADGIHRFEQEGGRVDLAGWMRSVGLTAVRAGLVLSGDLAVASRVIRREDRAIAELSKEDTIDDLLAFCASEKLAVLREWLGVAARPSMRPPMISSPSVV
jgi:tetratricopeptide (TPR) repeat protein